MSESDRKHVDGCAIFYRTEKYVSIVFVLWQLFLGLRIARSDLSSCGQLD